MTIADAQPASATPARRPGSVRRTTTHDSLRPDGLRGPVSVLAQGRDLRTRPDGATDIVAVARGPAAWLVNRGLSLVNRSAALKRAFARQALGTGGELPRLARELVPR